MSEIEIDYREPDAKKKIIEALDQWIEKDTLEKLEIQIRHIVSADFEEDFENIFEMEEVTDFNGWQCDWWNTMEYKDNIFNLYGEAWYGNIKITS